MSTETQRGLTADQLNMLLAPLQPGRVRQQQGQSHLEAWDVRRWLTRIFGFGGWKDEILSCECVHSVISPVGNDPAPLKHRCTAVYVVTLRLTIKDHWGNVVGSWEDGATGDSVNQPSVGDAHDMALKTAVSQALKRCAVNLGDQFGLSLYNKGEQGAVVGRTLGHPVLNAQAIDAAQDAPVQGGELDEQREAPAEEPVPPRPRVPQQQRAMVQRDKPSEPDGAWTGEEMPQAPAPPVAASRAQLNMLNALISKKYGNLPRPQRLAAVAKLAGRPLESSADLTKREASAAIDQLTQLPDYEPQQALGAAMVAGHEEIREQRARDEAAKLAAGDEPDSDRIEAAHRDAIESVESPDGLGPILEAVNADSAAGLIGTVARDLLHKAAARKRDEFAADRKWTSGVSRQMDEAA